MRLELPQARRRVHELLVNVRWGDMDALGHVNNTVYFRYMEMARIDWLNRLGMMRAGDKTGPVVINAFCNFLKQVDYPADLRVVHSVGSVGRSSVDTYVELFRDDQPESLVATGGATVVWVDYAAATAVALPEGLRRILSALEAS